MRYGDVEIIPVQEANKLIKEEVLEEDVRRVQAILTTSGQPYPIKITVKPETDDDILHGFISLGGDIVLAAERVNITHIAALVTRGYMCEDGGVPFATQPRLQYGNYLPSMNPPSRFGFSVATLPSR